MKTQIILLSIGITAVIFDLIISIYQAATEFKKQLREFNKLYDTTSTKTAFHKPTHNNASNNTSRCARTTMRHNDPTLTPHQNPSTPHQNRRGGECDAGSVAGRCRERKLEE